MTVSSSNVSLLARMRSVVTPVGALPIPAILIIVAVCGLVGQPRVDAASINYGDMVGNTVVYTNVTESSITDPVPLFVEPGGTPDVTGDSIDFNPTNFGAFSQNGVVDLTNGELSFGVEAKTDFAIDNINFRELGTWLLAGVTGTDATRVDVSATGTVQILAVDGGGITPIDLPLDFTFAPNADGEFEFVTDAGLPLPHTWTGGQFFDIRQALVDNGVGFTLGATEISVSLNNQLTAESESGTISFIDKKDFGGVSVTVNMPAPGEIPEPGSLVLAGLGLFGLSVGVGRQR